jgi:hypothetical protein
MGEKNHGAHDTAESFHLARTPSLHKTTVVAGVHMARQLGKLTSDSIPRLAPPRIAPAERIPAVHPVAGPASRPSGFPAKTRAPARASEQRQARATSQTFLLGRPGTRGHVHGSGGKPTAACWYHRSASSWTGEGPHTIPIARGFSPPHRWDPPFRLRRASQPQLLSLYANAPAASSPPRACSCLPV